MRIVYISASPIPSRMANSVHVMNMCEAFGHLGHEVTLLAPETDRIEQGVDDWYSYYGVEPTFKIKKIGQLGSSLVLYGLLAAAYARQLGPDIVYGRYLPGCFFSSQLGQRVVYEAHEPVAGRVKRWMFKKMVRATGFQRLVVLSEALQKIYLDDFREIVLPTTVAYNAARLVESDRLPELEGDAELHVGYIGHLYQGKGMELILKMARQCNWAHFHIVGGHDRDIRHWKEVARDLDNLTFYGHVAPALAGAYRKAVDVLLLPSQRTIHVGRGSFEQWWSPPLKLFEYLSVGKPMICSDFLGEVVVDGHTGLLASPSDEQQWVEALRRLRRDKGLRQFIGANAKQAFLGAYSWEARARKVLAGLSGTDAGRYGELRIENLRRDRS